MAEYDVFLCHYSGDAPLADRLQRALTAAGVSVWYDGVEIKLGDSIVGKMQEGIQKSRHGLILFTPGFLSSKTGFRWGEVEAYLSDQLATGRTHILPLAAGVEHDEYSRKLPLLRSRRYERIVVDPTGNVSDEELGRATRVVTEVTTLRTLVQMVGRDDLNKVIGGLEDRIPQIQERLMVSGNDCKALVESKSAFLMRALDRGVGINIMCVDPASSSAVDHLVRIDPRFDERTDFILSMQAVERVLSKLRSSYPDLFAFRYLPVAPAVGLYISDPGLPTALTKVELYTPKPWNPIATRAHVIVRGDSAWAEYFLSTWTNYWDMSRVPDV
jgi:hypothetical protein